MRKKLFAAAVVAASSFLAVGLTASEPVLRSSVSRPRDLIEALRSRGRFDDAEEICQRLTRVDSNPAGDAVALQAIEISRTSTARLMSASAFSDQSVVDAKEPVARLLESYPKHPRSFFLEAQLVAVDQSFVRSAAVASAIGTKSSYADLSARLLRATSATIELANRVADHRVRLQAARSGDHGLLNTDLLRLEQQLRVDAVSLSLLQTELFIGDVLEAADLDVIAAATKAERAADEALQKLPAGSPASIQVQRLKADAILRAGQTRRAAEVLSSIRLPDGEVPPASMQALTVRIAIASNDWGRADALLHRFYVDDNHSVGQSIDMDLAKLEFLLGQMKAHQNDGRDVAQWTREIRVHGGQYAGRRAEATSLRHLRGSAADSSSVDASLVASQGRDWFRRGDTKRAAELLAAAALADQDASRSLRHATQAAAAWDSIGDPTRAAEVLRTTSIKHPQFDTASAVHLQSAILLSRSSGSSESIDVADPNNARQEIESQVQTSLRENVQRWPAAATALTARTWLIQLLTDRKDFIGAAEAATLGGDSLSAVERATALQTWLTAFLDSDDAAADGRELGQRYIDAIEGLSINSENNAFVRRGSAMILDRKRLLKISDARPEAGLPGDRFIDALIRARQSGTFEDPQLQPPADLSEIELLAVAKRLMMDARAVPTMRPPVARWLQERSFPNTSPLQIAERSLWLAAVDVAIDTLRSYIADAPKSFERVAEAGRLLASSNEPEAQKAALAFFDQLAAGSVRGSELWHDAKIAAIELLYRSGETDEARRRTDYILLTVPDLQSDRKSRYQSLAKP